MDPKDIAELNSIKNEIYKIVRSMLNVSHDIRNSCKGIEIEKCAKCIEDRVNDLCNVKKMLDNIDTD